MLLHSYGQARVSQNRWKGNYIKVSVDRKIKNFGITSDSSSDADFNANLESFSGNSAGWKATLTIPEGAKTIKFEWIREGMQKSTAVHQSTQNQKKALNKLKSKKVTLQKVRKL